MTVIKIAAGLPNFSRTTLTIPPKNAVMKGRKKRKNIPSPSSSVEIETNISMSMIRPSIKPMIGPDFFIDKLYHI